MWLQPPSLHLLSVGGRCRRTPSRLARKSVFCSMGRSNYAAHGSGVTTVSAAGNPVPGSAGRHADEPAHGGGGEPPGGQREAAAPVPRALRVPLRRRLPELSGARCRMCVALIGICRQQYLWKSLHSLRDTASCCPHVILQPQPTGASCHGRLEILARCCRLQHTEHASGACRVLTAERCLGHVVGGCLHICMPPSQQAIGRAEPSLRACKASIGGRSAPDQWC